MNILNHQCIVKVHVQSTKRTVAPLLATFSNYMCITIPTRKNLLLVNLDASSFLMSVHFFSLYIDKFDAATLHTDDLAARHRWIFHHIVILQRKRE